MWETWLGRGSFLRTQKNLVRQTFIISGKPVQVITVENWSSLSSKVIPTIDRFNAYPIEIEIFVKMFSGGIKSEGKCLWRSDFSMLIQTWVIRSRIGCFCFKNIAVLQRPSTCYASAIKLLCKSWNL